MTAPPRTRRRPAPKDRPTPENTRTRHDTDAADNTARGDDEFDFDQRVVHQVDSSIWRALFNDEFRLAVRCDVCGRWLTDGRSKRAHRGPRCAAKVVTEK